MEGKPAEIHERALRVSSINYLFRTLSYSRDYYQEEFTALHQNLDDKEKRNVLDMTHSLFMDGREGKLAAFTGLEDAMARDDRFIIYGMVISKLGPDNPVMEYLSRPEVDFDKLYYDHAKRNVLMGILLAID